jgi:hypothetical protein
MRLRKCGSETAMPDRGRGGTSLRLCEGPSAMQAGKRLTAAEPGASAKTRLTNKKAPLAHGSSGQRPLSLQPGVERPQNAQPFGRATPG